MMPQHPKKRDWSEKEMQMQRGHTVYSNQMIGFRDWFAYSDVDGQCGLVSQSVPFIWNANVVGEKLDRLEPVTIEQLTRSSKVIPEYGFFASFAHRDMGGGIYPPFGTYIGRRDKSDYYGHFLVGRVSGKVGGFGKVHVHEFGFRSEFMQIHEIYIITDRHILYSHESLLRHIFQSLSLKYDCEVIVSTEEE